MIPPYFPATPGGQWSTGIRLRDGTLVCLIQDRPFVRHLDQDKIAREILRTVGMSTAERELDLYFPLRRHVCPERGEVLERCPTLELLELIADMYAAKREVGV